MLQRTHRFITLRLSTGITEPLQSSLLGDVSPRDDGFLGIAFPVSPARFQLHDAYTHPRSDSSVPLQNASLRVNARVSRFRCTRL